MKGANTLMIQLSPEKINDIYYVCSLLEFTARKTKNKRCDIIKYFTKSDISRQLRIAQVNHCLSFEQVSDELIEQYEIKDGEYDSVAECKYTVPSYLSIGSVYQTLITDVCGGGDIEQTLIDVFSSFISDEISYFNSNGYYSNPDYLRCSYLEGEMLS